MNDKTITLSVGLLNSVLQYLGAKPYQETFQLIQAIQEQASPQVTQSAEEKPE
jgi:hypothetical protein